MKPIRIEFIEDLRWRWASMLASVFLFGMSAGLGWQWYEVARATAAIEEQVAQARLRLAQLKREAEAARTDPKRLQEEAVVRRLRRDWNKVFAVMENLSEPGVRLRSMDVDATAGVMRLEYQLDSMAHAATVTTLLNAGYESPPWKLESVTGAGRGEAAAAAPQHFRGIWSGALDAL